MPELRSLRESDLGDLMALSVAANWNQTEDDWRRMLRFAPAGCFGIEDDGRVVASATVITYGLDLAWIGMVLTLPEARGRGYATRLMRRCIESVDVPCIKLDATDLGRPVYQRLGFVEEYTVQRYRADLPIHPKQSYPLDLELDRLAFGADRAALLHDLGVARPGRTAAYLGPVVSRTPEDARLRLLGAGCSGLTMLDVPDTNSAAVALARELGFEPFRQLWRMRRGTPIQERPDLVYALAGFEFG